jgi:uncharacterized protein YjbI with pentapeptide repeats
LCSTVHLFEWARDITDINCPFEDDFEKLSNAHEDLREEKFLDDVFGDNSKLDNEPFLKGCISKANWIFSSKDLRNAVFKQAGLQYKL